VAHGVERLRLFPLQVVLFPGMALPLVVFEERYRVLLAECLETREPFGVALIREGVEVGGPAVPCSMGTTARIRSIQRLPDGRLALDTVGERRFRIVALHHDRPYLSATVEYPVDEVVEVPGVLMNRVSERYTQVLRLEWTGAGGHQRTVSTPDSAGALADLVGALQSAPAADMQQLLEMLDVRRRLERADELLEAALAVAHQRAASAVAARWGTPSRLN
jgi:Lon protease-like protein